MKKFWLILIAFIFTLNSSYAIEEVVELENKEKTLKEKAEVEQALCTAKDYVPEPIDYENKKAMFSDALDALRDPVVPAKYKNMLLKRCISRINYYRQKKPKEFGNRWGEASPMELDVHLTV